MKPEAFENAIRLQFDCLARKVVDTTVKDYNRVLGRRAKKEIPFCELPDMEVEKLGFVEEYPDDYITFSVFGTEVKVFDEKLRESIKELTEQRRDILLMSYYLEIPDVQISEILNMTRSSVYRNRMKTLELIREMLEEED